jgi:oxalate decarboxylase/phosphoglucose isomerase-like protein (cupin superfamily)
VQDPLLQPASGSPGSVRPLAPQFLTFRKIPDPRGNLTPVEGSSDIPFSIRRVYWIYDVPGGSGRGGHAYRTLEEVFVALSGSFDLSVEDEFGGTVRHTLNRSYYGVYVPPLHWRRLENFSTNGVCLVLASQPYDEADYIRDFETYCAVRGLP